ncbi:hypothetical protein [Streptomyces sp. NPDC097981]
MRGLQRHQVERTVGDARMGLGDLARVADVGLAHLQEPAAARQQAQ